VIVETPPNDKVDELLDEESIAVLAILLAVALEFGFGFAKTVVWWAGLIAGPAALLVLVGSFRMRRTHVGLVRMAAWVVRPRERGVRRRLP
jgi:nitrate reductase NapE component